MKRLLSVFFAIVIMLTAVSTALASEAGAAATAAGGDGNTKLLLYLFIVAGATMAFGALGPAISQGRAICSAVEAMARNPGVSGKVLTAMLIGLAMIEALAIYVLVVVLILLFVFGSKLI